MDPVKCDFCRLYELGRKEGRASSFRGLAPLIAIICVACVTSLCLSVRPKPPVHQPQQLVHVAINPVANVPLPDGIRALRFHALDRLCHWRRDCSSPTARYLDGSRTMMSEYRLDGSAPRHLFELNRGSGGAAVDMSEGRVLVLSQVQEPVDKPRVIPSFKDPEQHFRWAFGPGHPRWEVLRGRPRPASGPAADAFDPQSFPSVDYVSSGDRLDVHPLCLEGRQVWPPVRYASRSSWSTVPVVAFDARRGRLVAGWSVGAEEVFLACNPTGWGVLNTTPAPARPGVLSAMTYAFDTDTFYALRRQGGALSEFVSIPALGQRITTQYLNRPLAAPGADTSVSYQIASAPPYLVILEERCRCTCPSRSQPPRLRLQPHDSSHVETRSVTAHVVVARTGEVVGGVKIPTVVPPQTEEYLEP